MIVKKFKSYGPMSLGAGTEVSYDDIAMTTKKDGRETMIRITAHVTMTKDVYLVTDGLAHNRCSICGCPPGLPDNEGLLELLENHEDGRLAFPASEDDPLSRDHYVVPGWKTVDSELTCGECSEAVAKSKAEVRKLRKQKGMKP